MKRFAGWAVLAGLMMVASAADAQMLAPYRAASDFDGPYERPYGAMPPAPPPAYNYGGYGAPPPSLLPPQEVYAVLRDNGFSPLGVPRQRGFVYTIAVVDRNGDDGRLVIDARNGRIIRFVPAWGNGPGRFDESYNTAPRPAYGYGPQASLPPPSVIRGLPTPPVSVPHVASAVPMPAPKPVARPVAPVQQSAAIETRPTAVLAPAQSHAQTAQTTAPQPANPPAAEAKPAPTILPTQQMPPAQGLE